jgi:hypothetical protein
MIGNGRLGILAEVDARLSACRAEGVGLARRSSASDCVCYRRALAFAGERIWLRESYPFSSPQLSPRRKDIRASLNDPAS